MKYEDAVEMLRRKRRGAINTKQLELLSSTRDASISSRGGTNAGFSKMLCDAVYWPTSKKEPAGYILYLCIKLRLEDLGHCFCNSPPATCITWINDWTCNYISGLYFSIMSKVTNNWIFAYFVFVIFHNNLLV